MLRRDGHWKFFVIEVLLYQHSGDDGWVRVEGNGVFAANIPREDVFDGPQYNGILKWPYSEFSSSGKCWQQTGEDGTFDEKAADLFAEALARYNPKYVFRVSHYDIKQVRTSKVRIYLHKES